MLHLFCQKIMSGMTLEKFGINWFDHFPDKSTTFVVDNCLILCVVAVTFCVALSISKVYI